MNRRSTKNSDTFSDIKGDDGNGINVNIFDITAHNNIFSHLKVHDCCDNSNDHDDVDDNNCVESANKRSGMNIPLTDVSVLSNVNTSSSCNFTAPDFRTCKNGISVSHLNVQSILPSLDEIKLWLKENPYDIFTLSETWLDSSVDDSEIHIPGYVIERADRNRHGGGVAVYIKNDIQYERRSDVEHNDIESLWLEVKQMYKKPIIIAALYCRSQKDVPDYLDSLSEIMDGVSNENKELILMGDLNCDFLKKNSATTHMSSFLNVYSLDQLVTKPTRVTPTSRSLIDVIMTTNRNICAYTDVVHHSFSDHALVHTVIFNMSNSSKKNKKRVNDGKGVHVTKNFRSFKNFNPDNFVTDLNHVDWNIDDSLPVNEAWDLFVNKFTEVCNNHAPVKSIRFKQKLCPWLEHRDDIFNLMHERDYHHNKAIHCTNKDNDHWNKYKVLRNKVNVMMRDAKREYYTNEINDSAGDMGKMWKTLKDLLPNKKGNSTTLPSTTESDLNLADNFNKHFTNIGTCHIDLNNSSNAMCNNDIHVNSKFTFTDITVDQVLDELNAISSNKASGLDNVCTKLIKYGSKAIAVILCKIFNMCLKQGCVPDELKVARVTPIYKSGSKDELTNYRPISILPVCSKILEKIVHNQLYNYVTENNLMYVGQSGFRKHHSTCTALIKTIDKWNMDIDNGNYVGAVFVDLSKAFDMVNHTLLVRKLNSLGITGNENNWFKSYLSNRTQCVSINGCVSTPNVIMSGVPQGSILGPLLFLLFINDMPKNIGNSTVDMYADDTLIYVSHKDVDVIEKYLNEDLACLGKWLDDNLMKVNVSKTKVMLLGTNSKTSKIDDINVFMNNTRVEKVNCFKYLGVTIDANLKWTDHVNNVYRKMCNSLGIMRRIKPFIPQSSLVTIYNTMFLPHLDYGIIVWSNCGDSQLNKIQKLQNTAMRIILSAPFRTHINDMLRTLGFMDVRSRISYVTGCMMYKVLNGMAPSYLNDSFNYVNNIHSLRTRRSRAGDLYIPRCNTNYGKNTFQYKGCILWNVMCRNIRNCNNFMSFKVNFKKDFKL